MAGHASTEDIEQGFDITLCVGMIDDREGTESQSRVHLADGIARGAPAFDDDGRRGRRESGEQVEHAGARFFAGGIALVEGEGEIDHGDVDWVGLDHPLGGGRGVGDVGLDAHGGEHRGDALDPGGLLPACG